MRSVFGTGLVSCDGMGIPQLFVPAQHSVVSGVEEHPFTTSRLQHTDAKLLMSLT